MTIALADSRLIVIDRDGNRCQRCGVKREEIHHRYRRGMGGSTHPLIHSVPNLVCLCARCHRRAETQRATSRELEGWCVPALELAPITPMMTLTGWQLPTAQGTWLWVCPTYQANTVDAATMMAARYGLIGGTDDHL